MKKVTLGFFIVSVLLIYIGGGMTNALAQETYSSYIMIDMGNFWLSLGF